MGFAIVNVAGLAFKYDVLDIGNSLRLTYDSFLQSPENGTLLSLQNGDDAQAGNAGAWDISEITSSGASDPGRSCVGYACLVG
jgi:hypothetical protein